MATIRNNYYNKKVLVCYELSGLNVKKITEDHIIEAAKKYNIPLRSAKKAWKIFQETGGKKVDKRGSGSKPRILMTATIKPLYTKKRVVTADEAAEAILEYMTTDIKSIELCNQYRITPEQFYNWINELQVSGTLLGRKVLNHNKYAKIEILDVIRISKRPNTTKKSIIALTELERAAYERVGTVLKKYLSAIAEG